MNARASQTGVCEFAAPNMSNNDVSTSHMMADYLNRIGAGKVLLDRAPFSVGPARWLGGCGS